MIVLFLAKPATASWHMEREMLEEAVPVQA